MRYMFVAILLGLATHAIAAPATPKGPKVLVNRPAPGPVTNCVDVSRVPAYVVLVCDPDPFILNQLVRDPPGIDGNGGSD